MVHLYIVQAVGLCDLRIVEMMRHKNSFSRSRLRIAFAALSLAMNPLGWTASGQEVPSASVETAFREQIQPLLKTHCLRCHNADEMKSGVRVDRLDGNLEDGQLSLLNGMREQIADELMPPEDEPQPTAEERQLLVASIDKVVHAIKSRKRPNNGSIRRLTVAQYRNTLRDLLGLEDDFTDVLPPDAVSKDGFLNNQETMLLSPLLVEAYFNVAEQVLERCIVDKMSKPVIQNFRMDLGAGINAEPYPDPLILGAFNKLLENQDFVVTQLTASKPFEFDPYRMQTEHRFIEGYEGNETVRGWREFDSIYHSVFACMRGADGYPKGQAYQTVPEGLLLRPAIPSAEIFQVESTYGPRANFKISLRELPNNGRFRVTVKAAKYDDGLLLDAGQPLQEATNALAVTTSDLSASADATIAITEAGVYQVEVYFVPSEEPDSLSLTLGGRHFSGQLLPANAGGAEQGMAFLQVRLPAGRLKLAAQSGDNTRLRRVAFSRLNEDSEAAKRFRVFEQRTPLVGVHLGLRRDCGSTLTRVGTVQSVEKTELLEYVFEGAISNFPSPEVEKDNVNYLAGIREIGIRSEYTDGRDMPRLLIRSVEFEGPLYESWPPASHRNIFIDSENDDGPAAYARQVIRSFATRAFRRPITDAETAALFAVWESSFAESDDFVQSTKDALLVVLTSPQFLFLIENSSSPEPEDLESYELASKLSYFLWNTAPDEQLLKLGAANTLHESLDAEIERMLHDPRCRQFVREFTSQWLSLDKFDVVEVDRERYPKLTRDAKTQLRDEPVQLMQYLIEQNLPLRNLIQSDFILANETVASYYGLADRTESGFQFVPIRHENKNLGGILSQAGILAGLSDGRESNPVKRGAWLARKIIAEPPDDPPPNVPELPEDDGAQLTLREKLERHRNQKGCAKCHSGIDPWGLPFEVFDAGGLFKRDVEVDARSTLPDKTEIADLNELKTYLANDRIDQVAFSFMKHLASYAVGRSLTYNEVVFLQEHGLDLRPDDYRMQDMIRLVITSDLFLKK